ncbi:hypothetical protein Lal_00028725 [Lupinus albus]|uniref:Putative F-box domain-containing protein n=1 Tax=Lupinus albus TaxID=3870 RepID=A0A6A4NZM0_LUPAL|nr:putative F-box domain-containing protein [Lupinus albus]KAF1884838.1 hypothetical protein Lal_00028725 [Lupinus albus]
MSASTANIISSMSFRSSSNSNWSDLPSDVMELILQKLTLMDYLKCREICQSWQNMVRDALSTKGKCPPKPHFPFIIEPTRTIPFLVNPINGKYYSFATELNYGLSLERFIGEETLCSQKTNIQHYVNVFTSVEGWLIIQDYFNARRWKEKDRFFGLICFYNPVSKAMIKLPTLCFTAFEDDAYESSKVVMSSKPDCKDSIIVILLYQYWTDYKLFFCKVRGLPWTKIETQHCGDIGFSDIAIHGSKLYAITNVGCSEYVVVFNLSNPNAVTSERIVMVQDPKEQGFTFPHWEIEDCAYEKSFLLMDSTSGDLFIVHCMLRYDEDFENWPLKFAVYKLDKSVPRWLKIERFDDKILLLDDKGIQFISTTNLDGPCMESIQTNCVYFTLTTQISKEIFNDIGVFTLSDKKIQWLECSLAYKVGSVWFTPSLW